MALPNAANIVILASNYNPSIVSKEWLYQRGIFTEKVDNFMHTPILAVIENQNFGLAVDEQKLQITIKRITQDNLANANNIISRFIDILPETPYKGIGYNYRYNINEDLCNLDTFFSPKRNNLKVTFSKDYQLGTMIVFSFEGFITTFTVSPSLIEEQPVRISFNFHSDVANVVEVRSKIPFQKKTLRKAESIIKELCKNG